jgi:predicted GNAT family N-acyltransferase
MEIGKIIIDEPFRNQGKGTELIEKMLELLPEDKQGVIGIVSKFQDKDVMNRIFEKLGASKDYA